MLTLPSALEFVWLTVYAPKFTAKGRPAMSSIRPSKPPRSVDVLTLARACHSSRTWQGGLPCRATVMACTDVANRRGARKTPSSGAVGPRSSNTLSNPPVAKCALPHVQLKGPETNLANRKSVLPSLNLLRRLLQSQALISLVHQ